MTFKEWLASRKPYNMHLDYEDLEDAWKAGWKNGNEAEHEDADSPQQEGLGLEVKLFLAHLRSSICSTSSVVVLWRPIKPVACRETGRLPHNPRRKK